MFSCATSVPVELLLNAAQSVTEPLFVHAVAAWLLTARLADLVALVEVVALENAPLPPPLAFFPLALLYVKAGWVILCVSFGVVAFIVFV
jgi:hypothetical protein